ncbi:hypothetical protein ABK040_001093 [Willaertia magna]
MQRSFLKHFKKLKNRDLLLHRGSKINNFTISNYYINTQMTVIFPIYGSNLIFFRCTPDIKKHLRANDLNSRVKLEGYMSGVFYKLVVALNTPDFYIF